MKRVLLGAVGLLWFFVVFVVSFRLTFPSDAVADRVQYEIGEATGGAWLLEMRDVSPWWAGASARDVRLFKTDPQRPDSESTLAFAADSARVRVGVGSLMRQAPTISGAVELGNGKVDFVVGSRMNAKGTELGLGEVDIHAKSFPLSELAALAGASMEGRGTVDIVMKLDAPESMRTATGRASITGRSLMISKLDLSSMGVPDLGLEIPVDDMDLAIDIADGKAQIVRGVLRSDLATLEIEGDITLRDDLERSTLNIGLTVGNLGAAIQMFKSFLGEEWADGKFHYRCTGTIQRNSCRAERERSAGANANRFPGPRGQTPGSRAVNPTPRSTGAQQPMDADERERRKEELRERLRTRRDEGRSGPALPHRLPSRSQEEEYDEEEYDEEDLPEEEYLPMEDDYEGDF